MLKCPNCGAQAGEADVRCGYCGVQLQTLACPSCLGMMFRGAKHCVHCGARVFDTAADADAASGPHKCPRCKHALTVTAVGSAFLEECGGCGGVWVDAQSFQQLCQSREQQAAYVGAGSPLPPPSLGAAATHEAAVQYVRCPLCARVMNRMNFARHSGVVVDVCNGHGTWFDRDELRQIVEFIRDGGLDAAREKDRVQLELERERLRSRERTSASMPVVVVDGEHEYEGVVSAVRDLLRWLV
jgi:Zn-finger nucleic acid-binding protein